MSHAPALATSVKALTRSVLFDLVCEVRPIVFKLLAVGSAAGLVLGILASRGLAFIVYQATPRHPLVLAGVVLAMSLLGLVATWIPAPRALSVNPTILLREE